MPKIILFCPRGVEIQSVEKDCFVFMIQWRATMSWEFFTGTHGTCINSSFGVVYSDESDLDYFVFYLESLK